MEYIAEVADITQGYGKRQVLSGLAIQIQQGTLGILGPNGAGKTTLLRTLATVTPPRSGSIEICGERVRSERTAQRARRNIGYLPQDFGFMPSFSVYDFVRYNAWLRRVRPTDAHRLTLDAIAIVGLADRSESKMGSLSGGMLRRAGIASAVVGSPRLLLLDEPTVGLDPAQRLEFRQMIRSLTATAVVLSTHLVEDVAAACDTVAVLRDGKIIFFDTPQELCANGHTDAAGDSPIERGYMTVLNDRVVSA